MFFYVLDLLKCFNLLHSSPRVNREYLAMSEAVKSGVLIGMYQEKHEQNEISGAEQQSDRILMFVCHTYDTLNQLIAVYLSKLKDQLLLVELTKAGEEFIYKVFTFY